MGLMSENRITRARRFKRERYEALGIIPHFAQGLTTITEYTRDGTPMVHRLSLTALEHFHKQRAYPAPPSSGGESP